MPPQQVEYKTKNLVFRNVYNSKDAVLSYTFVISPPFSYAA